MIKSDYILVRDRIREKDSIESIVDINNNYYKRYDDFWKVQPISYKTNMINPLNQIIYNPTKRYINYALIDYILKDITVVLLRDKPRKMFYKEFTIKSATITFEEL